MTAAGPRPSAGANSSVPRVTVTGTAEAGATVLVNGQSVRVNASGGFSAQVSLGEGASLIRVTSTDAAGNTATAVTYTNPAPAAQVQSNLASLGTMNLILIVLVVVSLGLGAFEFLQIRKLRGGGAPPPEKPEASSPPREEL